jgi:hypothetical protein
VPKETNLQQDHFYFNNLTHVTQWNRPMEMAYRDKQTGRQYWSVLGKVSWDPPAELAWRTVPYNSTMNSTMTRPAAAPTRRRSRRRSVL